MSRAVAIGDERRLAGYALAGAAVLPAATPEAVDAVWAGLDEETDLLVLTPEAHARLRPFLAERNDVIWVVLPS